MPEKLKEIIARYSEIERLMSLPENYSDAGAYSRLAKELKELTPVAECAKEYFECGAAMAEAEGFFSDPEMGEMAREEYEDAKKRKTALSERIKELLVPKDPDDERNVIIEIRAGVGGEESALFAHSLYRMYTMYAEAHRFKVSVANVNETELGGIKEISFMVEARGPTRASSTRAASTACSVCPRPRRAGAYTPVPSLWPCCRRSARSR